MVATLILVRDGRGNLHDQEGHLRNAVSQRIDSQGAAIPEAQLLNHSDQRWQCFTVKKPQTTSRRINDPGIIAACHCGAEYDIEYSASIETHTVTSIDSVQPKSTDAEGEESVDIRQGEWENDYYIPTMAKHIMHTEEYDEDYEEERDIEQRATLDEEDRLLHHSPWKKKSPSIDRYSSTSIDTQPHQPNHLRASTDNAYFPLIDTNVDATRDGDYSIGSWADDRYHESYAVETAYRDQ
ncbi:hypothetical protein F2Q68_00006020 [Brassica cretica]|uniref:Uncharacterized protein n=1 Tax=Brassica cretica TaxID=69181 RepID=A0A8S9JAJ0_BRACR|nr:hypothetical protein F2Q68_00006020 [Brassica cretica]